MRVRKQYLSSRQNLITPIAEGDHTLENKISS